MAEAEMPPASGSQEHSRGDYAAGRGCKSGLMHGACQVPAALVQRCLGFGGLGRAARTDLECHICIELRQPAMLRQYQAELSEVASVRR